MSAPQKRTERARLLTSPLVGVLPVRALGGAGPGYVGSCERSGALATPSEYCPLYRAYFCAREFQGGRINAAEYTTCADQSTAFCVGFNFDSACHPTKRRAESCIQAMMDAGRVSTPTSSLPECQYCGGV